MRILLACLLSSLAAPALAQSAEDIITKPARDVNVMRKEIPPVLTSAVAAPYGNDGTANCAQLTASLEALDAALGPDFDSGNVVATGVTPGRVAERVVASIIPFRGVVREVSGAASAERRYEAAVDAGIARRGYLRGLAQSKRCRAPAGKVAASN